MVETTGDEETKSVADDVNFDRSANSVVKPAFVVVGKDEGVVGCIQLSGASQHDVGMQGVEKPEPAHNFENCFFNFFFWLQFWFDSRFDFANVWIGREFLRNST